MSVAILCIGTELTRGEIVNTNASWLAERVTRLGLEVTATDCVDDDRSRIVAALSRLGATHRVLLVTGGLGPTTDDLTQECAAEAAGVPLERHEPSLAAIRASLERRGRTLGPSNAKQADLPRGARALANDRGTAPGFELNLGRARAYFMPGVPWELQGLWERDIEPALTELAGQRSHQVRLRTFGAPEAAVNDRLAGIEIEHDVTLAYRAHSPEIEVKVLARAERADVAERRARAAADAVRARLGDLVFGEGDTELSEAVGDLLMARGARLGLAESCTGGLVASLCTARAGSSRWLAGGVVAYSNDLKQSALGVANELLVTHGAVSEPVARAMAEGARRRLGVDFALAITGVAGPGGGTDEKPVGLVHFALAEPRGTRAAQHQFHGTRAQVQRRAAFEGLALVLAALRE